MQQRYELVLEWFDTAREIDRMRVDIVRCTEGTARRAARRRLAEKHAEPDCVGKCIRIERASDEHVIAVYEQSL